MEKVSIPATSSLAWRTLDKCILDHLQSNHFPIPTLAADYQFHQSLWILLKAVTCLSTCPKPSHPSTSANRSGVSASASMARNPATQDIIDLTSVDESEDDDYTEVCCFKSLLHWILTGNVSLSLFL